MKNIELTEEHKSKLLEMCEKLFPKYDFPNGIQSIIFIRKKDKKLGENIHWFEFCMIHLAKKVLKNNYFRLTAFSNGVLFRNRQPIDILYYEFKKYGKN